MCGAAVDLAGWTDEPTQGTPVAECHLPVVRLLGLGAGSFGDARPADVTRLATMVGDGEAEVVRGFRRYVRTVNCIPQECDEPHPLAFYWDIRCRVARFSA